MRFEQLGIEAKCIIKFAASCLVIPAQSQGNSARCVCLSARWIKFERTLTRCVGSFEISLAAVPVHVKERTAIGHTSVCAREVRIDLNRAVKHAQIGRASCRERV